MPQEIREMQSVAVQNPSFSKFNGTHTVKHTQKIADLVPADMIPYYPGDKFDGSVQTAFNFPPLVSPAYQGFTQKSYMFKVRKGLVWHNDGIRNQLNCLKSGDKLTYAEPNFAITSTAYFGTEGIGVRFCPKIPVFGTKAGYLSFITKQHEGGALPAEVLPVLSANRILQFDKSSIEAFIDHFNRLKENMFHCSVIDGEHYGTQTENPMFLPARYGYHSRVRKQINAYDHGFQNLTSGTGEGQLKYGNIYDSKHVYQIHVPYPDLTASSFGGHEYGKANLDAALLADIVSAKDYTPSIPYLEKGANFAPFFVSSPLLKPSGLMESLNYPSFNYNPYVTEVSKRIINGHVKQMSAHLTALYIDGLDCYEDSTQHYVEQDDPSNEWLSDMQDLYDVLDNSLIEAHRPSFNSMHKSFQTPFFDSRTVGFEGTTAPDKYFYTTIFEMLEDYAAWCIQNGYGDGTIPADEDCPIFDFRLFSGIFHTPKSVQNNSEKSSGSDWFHYSLCPWLSFWHVYENYFRDQNVSPSIKPILKCFQTPTEEIELYNNNVSALMRKDISSDYITWDGIDFDAKLKSLYSDDIAPTYSMMFSRMYVAFCNNLQDVWSSGGSAIHVMDAYETEANSDSSYFYKTHLKFLFRNHNYNFFFNHPRKLLDKDVYSNLLPTTSKIEVFAPIMNAADVNTFLSDTGKEGFKALAEGMINGQNTAQPFSLNAVSSNNSFLSVDALRTAQILQRYYKNASLVGDQINQFILLTFGVHSQDFRPEVPELIFARESPCYISEITQQSETEQLPLGTEGGKMTSSSESIPFHVDSRGDFGYIIYLTCVYPETSQFNGLDDTMHISHNVFNQLFVPQFSTLGEESVPVCKVDFAPKAVIDDNGSRYDSSVVAEYDTSMDKTLGYAPRYTFFKFLPNRIKGRFKGDMNYWTLDRLADPFGKYPTLSHQYLQTPRDLRLFASDEVENCYGFTFMKCNFIRAVASSDYQPVI